MVAVVVIAVVFTGFVGSVVLRLRRARLVDARRERRSLPTSRRMAERRQFRGYEHDLLAQRSRTDGVDAQ